MFCPFTKMKCETKNCMFYLEPYGCLIGKALEKYVVSYCEDEEFFGL